MFYAHKRLSKGRKKHFWGPALSLLRRNSKKIIIGFLALLLFSFVIVPLSSVPPEGKHGPPINGNIVNPDLAQPPPKPDKFAYELAPKSRENDTIVVLMASFRDNDCHKSVLSAFENAIHPDRIRFAIFQQHDPQQDTECDDFSEVCPGHPACTRMHQVRVNRVHYTEAKGPTYGRAMQDKMIDKDEVYAMQIDAHMVFVPGWDLRAIDMWLKLKNDYAVITTYVRDIKASMNPETGLGKDDNIVMVCNTQFKGANGMPRHSTGGIVRSPFKNDRELKGSPVMTSVWCAGLSFSAAHRVRNVPNDPYTPHIFDGEEFLMTAKLWTHGYDFYSPSEDLVFHPYGRSKGNTPQPLYQQVNPIKTSRESRQASSRIRHVLGMPSQQGLVANLTEIDEYSVGTERTLEEFYAIRKINVTTKEVQTICPMINSGEFHRKHHPKEQRRYEPSKHNEFRNFENIHS